MGLLRQCTTSNAAAGQDNGPQMAWGPSWVKGYGQPVDTGSWVPPSAEL